MGSTAAGGCRGGPVIYVKLLMFFAVMLRPRGISEETDGKKLIAHGDLGLR